MSVFWIFLCNICKEPVAQAWIWERFNGHEHLWCSSVSFYQQQITCNELLSQLHLWSHSSWPQYSFLFLRSPGRSPKQWWKFDTLPHHILSIMIKVLSMNKKTQNNCPWLKNLNPLSIKIYVCVYTAKQGSLWLLGTGISQADREGLEKVPWGAKIWVKVFKPGHAWNCYMFSLSLYTLQKWRARGRERQIQREKERYSKLAGEATISQLTVAGLSSLLFSFVLRPLL